MTTTHLPTRQAPVVEPDVRERPQTDEPGDHDRFTHYVRQRELARSKRTGKPVTALCGKKWVPTGDPSKYPMCPTCSEIVAESFSNSLD